jgi:hypothetical protein
MSSGLAIAGLQYVLFLATAVLGFRQWLRAIGEGERLPSVGP